MPDLDKPLTDLGERFPRTAAEMDRLRAQGREAARDLCAFLDRSPTSYHAAREAAARLEAAGFSEISERDAWTLAPGDRRYFHRGGTIIAFVVGSESPATGGFRMIGAHTDSPNLRVKPNADVSRSGYQQLGAEVYGGVIHATWMDRDLSIAGRVLVRGKEGVEARLVDLSRPVARVPNIAIHLNRGVNKDGMVLNEQKHLVPIVGLGKEAVLRATLARAAEIAADDILGYDLSFYDTERAVIGGLNDDFVFSARLDNLASCHAATSALIASTHSSPRTRLIALYDHEECGSRSAAGAAGSVLRDTVARILEAHPDRQSQSLGRAMSRSLLVSADMAHGIHPNYADQHEPQHAPQVNRGLVIKSNSNQSYATDGESAARIELFCQEAGFSPQKFVVRSDLPCGSTIGPITAAELGIATVDVGAPMLSMHSCREMCGTLDVHLSIEAFKQALR
ncbi:Aspartyl aminopeptidase [Minicystis rosea]|nr:Aspartyl aminopeptidase [Minicystis rosea]